MYGKVTGYVANVLFRKRMAFDVCARCQRAVRRDTVVCPRCSGAASAHGTEPAAPTLERVPVARATIALMDSDGTLALTLYGKVAEAFLGLPVCFFHGSYPCSRPTLLLHLMFGGAGCVFGAGGRRAENAGSAAGAVAAFPCVPAHGSRLPCARDGVCARISSSLSSPTTAALFAAHATSSPTHFSFFFSSLQFPRTITKREKKLRPNEAQAAGTTATTKARTTGTATTMSEDKKANPFEEFRKYATEEGPWELVSDEKGMNISKRSVPGTSLHTQRGIVVINAPVQRVRDIIESVSLRPKWDSMVAVGEMIKRIDETHAIVRFATEAQWPVSAREFYVEVAIETDPDGRQTILANTPPDHETAYPTPKGFVRGVAQNSGYILEPVPGSDPQQTKMTFLTQRLSLSLHSHSPLQQQRQQSLSTLTTQTVDAKGWIPASIVAMSVSKDKMCLAPFKAMCEDSSIAADVK